VRFDWLPTNVVVGLGGLPWAALTVVREWSVLQFAPPAGQTAGDRLPMLILGMGPAHAKRVARPLHDARPEGVTLVEDRDGVLAVVISASGLYGVSRLDASAADAVTRFRREVETTGGWHAILVSTPNGRPDDPIYGFFECVLSPPSAGGMRGPRRPDIRSQTARRGRRRP
jgi:hypothetical protein